MIVQCQSCSSSNRLRAARLGEIVVANVDTEALPEVAGRFNIRSIPTMILFRGGREVQRLSGARPAGAIMADLSV
jgi:thioredoxin 2